MVVRFTVRIVYYKSGFVGGESATSENIVSAVVYTAEKVLCREDICKFVILAEIWNIYSGSAVPNMTV